MKGYRDYMDRQQVSPALHDKLLALEQREIQHKPQPRKRWQPVLAMAACLCLVLGVCWSWSTFSPAAHSAASTAEYAMDDDAVWEETDAAQEDADESIPETAAAASIADEADEPKVEESAPAQEAFVEDTTEDEAAKEALTLPEGVLLPGWLPEGYALTQAEQDESGRCRLTWSNGTDEITLEYAFAGQPPEELDWPVFDSETANWETVSQAEEQDGVWGFCLYDKDLACWQCFTTAGDHKTLWDVAQSMTR